MLFNTFCAFLTQKDKFYRWIEKVTFLLMNRVYFKKEERMSFQSAQSTVTYFALFLIPHSHRAHTPKKWKMSETRFAVQSIKRNRKWFCSSRRSWLFFKRWKPRRGSLSKRKEISRVIKLENTCSQSKTSFFKYFIYINVFLFMQ